MITIKNSHEQARMREAGKIVGDTLRFIEPYVKPGVTTAELDQLMENFIRSRGAVPNFKHLYGFPPVSPSTRKSYTAFLPNAYCAKAK